MRAPTAIRLPDGTTLRVRALRPGDAPAVQRFARGLSPWSRMARWFAPIAELSALELERLAAPGPLGSLSLVALDEAGEMVALAEISVGTPGEGEFALVVAEGWRRRGLARALLERLEAHGRGAGLVRIVGLVQRDNPSMLALARSLGYTRTRDPDPALVCIEKPLAAVFTKDRPAAVITNKERRTTWTVR